MNDGLGQMPDPTTQEPELEPGGPDALDTDPADVNLPRDLDPDSNPAVDDVLPDEISEPDDKQQEPDDDGSGDASDQEAGSVEPPA